MTRECAARAAGSSVPAHLRPNISTDPAHSITCEEAFVLFHVISSSAPAKGRPRTCGGRGDDCDAGAKAPASPLKDAGKAWGCSHVVVGGVKYFVLFADGSSCPLFLRARSCSSIFSLKGCTTVPLRASGCSIAYCTWSLCLAGMWPAAAPELLVVDRRLPMRVLTVKHDCLSFLVQGFAWRGFRKGAGNVFAR